MTTPIHSDTGARALGALPADEASEFDEHLADCDTCPQEYAEFLDTVAILGSAVAEAPPDRLRSRVLDEVSRTPQLPPDVDSDQPATSTPHLAWWRRRSVQVTAAAVAAAVIAGGVTWGVWPEGPSPQQETAECVAQATDALVQHPEVGEGGSVTIAPSCSAAVVQVAKMPTLPHGEAYQMWVIAGKQARSAGMVAEEIDSSGDVVVADLTASDTAIGISVEPEGGSKQPTTTPIWVTPLRS